ncbi:ATP-binding protein [Anaerosalibacter sp. Marseille-P3206]|uniref:ATP-binding protein n=1 Tax=Anaerosalibacter sp. Marseille-P3206 TaxID=1871005 RepID=UPI0009865F56|nr:ATP-binding protein [Anaerosalibacter sp. Marseille-P3206]
MEFIGREYELNSLEKLYREDTFQFVVMYGRRRVGKTRLLMEFCKDKNSIFFVAEEYNDKVALEKFSKKILEHFHMDKWVQGFDSWEKAFLFLNEKAKEEPLVLIIDEFPYIVSANHSIPSLMQNLIDHQLKDRKLFIVVCGSSMSFMEKEILSYKSPLYGRRTAQIKIEPFNFFDSIKFFPDYGLEDKVIAYGIVGGIPQYLLKFKDVFSIEQNIKEQILDKSSYLYEEPATLLKQELREPALYNSIIEAIATGSSKLNEIATKVGEDSSKTSNYIKSLIELEIVEKEVPVGEKKNSRKTIYSIKDPLFRFWYRFIFNNIGLIEQEMIDYVYEEKISPQLNDFLGNTFESICVDILKSKNKSMELPFVFENIGRWWGNNPIMKREEEIDILAISKDNALIGECKWRNQLLDMSVVNSLIEKSQALRYKNKYYVFFSKSGFTEEVISFSKHNKKIMLINNILT